MAEDRNATVLDPWNGSGTTTQCARSLGLNSIGFDLNPVMVLVAKAGEIDPAEGSVLLPLAVQIVRRTRNAVSDQPCPLSQVFDAETSSCVVEIARSIWLHVVASTPPVVGDIYWESVAPLAGCFFVALFNCIRRLLRELRTTNPTWLKLPKLNEPRIKLSRSTITTAFIEEVKRLQGLIAAKKPAIEERVTRIFMGDSRVIPLASGSVGAVVTSPPYCTRLDYGRSTMVELLILESIGVANYMKSRQELMGGATSRKSTESTMRDVGAGCKHLLQKIQSHPSKASSTYYHHLHQTYFNDLFDSLGEIARVLRIGGRACIVAQDSYYKEIHNDVPTIICEMAEANGMKVHHKFEYRKSKSMCRINRSSRVYRTQKTPVEVALLLSKEN